MPVSWSEELSVGVEVLDNQHKKLVAMLNDLEAAIEHGQGREACDDIVTRMSDYAQEHFKTEEALMREHAFPDLEAHVLEHEDFVVKVMDIYFDPGSEQSSPEGVLAFLRDWLMNHISKSDKAYAPCMR